MKKVLRNALLLTGICLAVVACNKDDDDDNNGGGGGGGSKTDQLAATWQITSLVLDSANIDIWPLVDACDRDDLIIFETNGNGTYDEGATKCDPTDPQTEAFTWVWLNNETSLRIIDPTDTMVLTNVTISGSTMTAKQMDDFFGDATVTLTKQ